MFFNKENLKNNACSFAVLAFAFMGTANAWAEVSAQDGKSETNAATVIDPKQQAAANATENVDDVITNNNLRALSGSTSKWSIASQFEYLGGTIGGPLDQNRPDISGASGTTAKADLDGSISAKYNINQTNSILAGIGVRWIAPFSTGNLSGYNGSAFDIMNPYITYQHVYKWLGIQSVLQVQMLQWTQSDFTALGYGQQLNVDQENMYEIPGTHLSVGASVAIQYQFFNKSGAYGTPGSDNYIPDISAEQSQYLFTVAPVIEYQISDKLNFRTLVNVWTYEHYKQNISSFSFVHDTIYQSVGLGISITRDVFLYPNIQFLPGQLEASLTNVGMTATINLF